MSNFRVSLWAFAVVGLAGVLFLSMYVTSSFTESTAYEDEVYTGLYIDTVNPPVILTSSEQKRIDQWIKKNNFNQYGDPKGTVYQNGPLKKQGGPIKYTTRYEYLLDKHPTRPWNDGTESSENVLIDKWIAKNNLNEYGDPSDTFYIGGTPLFDEATGRTKDRYEYIIAKHPDRPWAVTQE